MEWQGLTQTLKYQFSVPLNHMEQEVETGKRELILAFLAAQELDQSVTAVAAAVGVSVPTAGRKLEALEAEGLAISRPAGSALLFRLTEKGLAAYGAKKQ